MEQKQLTGFALRHAEPGSAVPEIIRKMSVSEPDFFRPKKKHASVGVGEFRRLRQREEENNKLKHLMTDLSLDKRLLQDVIARKT